MICILIFQGEITEKKESDLEEVKVVVPSDEDEKKDAEKPDPCHLKYLNRLKEGRNVCQQKYNALERYGKDAYFQLRNGPATSRNHFCFLKYE